MKKAAVPFLLLAMALHGVSATSAGEAGFRRISMQEAAAAMLEEENLIILDVRTQAEYDAGHIPGAICIPNETIGSAVIPQLPNKNQPIYVYCRSGNRSMQAAGKLAKLGYSNVIEFGGINAWTGEITTE